MKKQILLAALLTTAIAVPSVLHAETVTYNQRNIVIIESPGVEFRDTLARIPYNDSTVAQALQQSLKDMGFFKGHVGNAWGPASEAALASYQGSKGMPATGALNEETVTRLGLVLPASEQVSEQFRILANKANSTEPVYTQVRYNIIERKLTPGEIQAIQQNLQDGGFYTANVDGIWGPKTTAGIRSFQMANGLRGTGQLNNPTVSAMGLQVSEHARIVNPQPMLIEPAAGNVKTGTKVKSHTRY